MRAQLRAMSERIDDLEAQLQDARAQAAAVPPVAVQTPTAAPVPAPAPVPAAATATTVVWKGAPQLSTADGWSFKPRGRVQVDMASINAPNGLSGDANRQMGTGVELRRLYFGVDGTMPGGFGYRVEADFAASTVLLTDVYLTYDVTKDVRVTVGQHKPFWGLEELASDLNLTLMERSTFGQAFNFERRVGASVQYRHGIVLAQGGVFGDDAQALNSDYDKNWSLDGRLVLMPRLAGGTLHLGGSVHFNHAAAFNATITDRVRPFAHTTDIRLITTGAIPASGERGLALEGAYIAGRFHATAESYWQTVHRSDGADPTFTGGYAEVGYLLTKDETAYKDGIYERIRPKHGLDKGGLGAIQINTRYDWLDLDSAGIHGGRQKTASLSAVWILTDYVRMLADYGHVWVNGSAYTTPTGSADYELDVVGMRAQYDF